MQKLIRNSACSFLVYCCIKLNEIDLKGTSKEFWMFLFYLFMAKKLWFRKYLIHFSRDKSLTEISSCMLNCLKYMSGKEFCVWGLNRLALRTLSMDLLLTQNVYKKIASTSTMQCYYRHVYVYLFLWQFPPTPCTPQ